MNTQLATIEMPDKEVKALAFDVACGFFKDDQLCTRFDLDIRQLKSIKTQRAFKKEVDEINRLLNDDGSEFVIKAKGMVDDVLDSLQEIVNDNATSDAARIKASKEIMSVARVVQAATKPGDGAVVGSIIINTNLSLNDAAKGAYTIEAKPIPHEEAEEIEYVMSEHSDLL